MDQIASILFTREKKQGEESTEISRMHRLRDQIQTRCLLLLTQK